MAQQQQPLGLYIHFPWCEHKCGYCDFNSYAGQPKATDVQLYVTTLVADFHRIRQWHGVCNGNKHHRKITSVFIGGGTPSLIAPAQLVPLFAAITPYLQQHCEVTIEANPNSSNADFFAGYQQLGVNRLSIGGQSFDTAQLLHLQRLHAGGDIVKAVKYGRAAGISNFNIDIIFGLAGQSTDAALQDLHQAIALRPTHISWYQLTIEANTQFANHPPQLPSDEAIWQIQQAGIALLAIHGYRQYEVSAYCREEQICQHNLNYWRYGDYMAIGAGAHGKYTNEKGVARYQLLKRPSSYVQAVERVAVHQPIAVTDLLYEYLLNVLRLRDRFTLVGFAMATKLRGECLLAFFKENVDRTMYESDNESIMLTDVGFWQHNTILECAVSEGKIND